MLRRRARRRAGVLGVVSAMVASLVAIAAPSSAATYTDVHLVHTAAYGDVLVSTNRIQADNGKIFAVTNHLVQKYAQQEVGGTPKEYLVVLASDENAADTVGRDAKTLPGSVQDPANKARNALVGPDFLAVIDATKGSPSYGRLVNTVTLSPLVYNELHHAQYTWHKGDTLFVGGLYTSTTYAIDVSALPMLTLRGVSAPTDTMCGSVPDAYYVLSDRTAYATYMGGPVLPGPCRYSDGSVRSGNGYAGSPGSVVHLDQNAKVLSISPAATPQGDKASVCDNLPPTAKPSCANPHGIQARPDLNRMVTGDYVEPRNLILSPLPPASAKLFRPTVRTWDISDRNHPTVTDVTYLPDNPASDPKAPLYRENSATMEVTVTQQPGHKGAFAQTMQGGEIFYAPDITVPHPQWRKVWDDGTAIKGYNPSWPDTRGAGTHGGWVQTSPNDKFLYHSTMGRHAGILGPNDPGTPGGMMVIDIAKLVNAGADPKCDLDKHLSKDCPSLAGAAALNPTKPGLGPHFGTVDNFALGPDGKYHETDQPGRLAGTDYFVSRAGSAYFSDHKLWVATVGKTGALSVDKDFNDFVDPSPGWDFNRASWPHGPFGNAKPHKALFVVADRDVAAASDQRAVPHEQPMAPPAAAPGRGQRVLGRRRRPTSNR
jgi:hypothetical protein